MRFTRRCTTMRHRGTRRRGGFTLVELLVVIAIICLLLSILSPSLGRAKALARDTACRSNLHQLAIAHVLYTVQNRGNFFEYRLAGIYMAYLEPFHQVEELRLCPEAPVTPASLPNIGGNRWAWSWPGNATPGGIDYGSYGINGWIYSPTGRDDLPGGAGARYWGCNIGKPFPDAWYKGTWSVPTPRLTPSFADCISVDGWPWWDDVVPDQFQGIYGQGGFQMARFCLDRHDLAVNVVFLDGHADHVRLGRLWTLMWSRLHQPSEKQIP